MTDESAKAGVLGHLPPWPRNALNNSVIAMEQAYRQRKGLPLLSDADIEALKAGQPMAWESGNGGATPVAPSQSAPAVAAPPAPAAVATPAAPTGGLSEDVAKWVAEGRKWSKSTIAAEQARRGRKGLPALNDVEIAALLGEPVAEPAPAAAPAPVAAASQPAVASGPISAEVAKWVAEGRKWSKSTIAAEQARRGRKGLPALNDAEMAALLGEQAAAPATPAPSAAAAAPAAPRPAAAKAAPASAAASVARGGESTSYVGTPAVGTSKAAAAGGIASIGPENSEVNQQRRRLVWSAVAAFLVAWFLAFFRFFLPRTLFEPATSFKIGYPEEYGLGVDTKFQQKYRIWVDRTPDRIFVIYARCTHLGCTPDWKPSENKFKCPCHGSGYDSEGVNFEGPAPRPMDRAKVDIAPDGQILVDVSKLYQWPKGQPSQFNDPGAFLRA
ncbi:MAG TPA: Rieske 2Fe-2S domain-containing protein [Terriglobales bacterium]|jgi:cytochrome b6-f complex iron-sulfur subunit|nr:Rieske 2Fe-2S domain-containing protein [Terriglobales bacterium]